MGFCLDVLSTAFGEPHLIRLLSPILSFLLSMSVSNMDRYLAREEQNWEPLWHVDKQPP